MYNSTSRVYLLFPALFFPFFSPAFSQTVYFYFLNCISLYFFPFLNFNIPFTLFLILFYQHTHWLFFLCIFSIHNITFFLVLFLRCLCGHSFSSPSSCCFLYCFFPFLFTLCLSFISCLSSSCYFPCGFSFIFFFLSLFYFFSLSFFLFAIFSFSFILFFD